MLFLLCVFLVVGRCLVVGTCNLSCVLGLTPIFVSLLFFLVFFIFFQEDATLMTDEWAMHPLGADAAVTVGAQS